MVPQRLHQPRLGTHKLHHLLRQPLEQAGIALGRDAMFDVLRSARMLVPVDSTGRRNTFNQRRCLWADLRVGCRSYQNALAERVNGILKSEFLLAWPADL